VNSSDTASTASSPAAHGTQVAVEYKTDWTASRTGNAFVETVSVDQAGKSGWAYTSTATYLMSYIPGDNLLYILTFATLHQQLPRWLRTYPTPRHPESRLLLHPFEQLAVEVWVIVGVG
jgi:hypothetical protein